MLRTWSECSERICQEIAARRATLKIVLKTKDDPLLLQQWIDHHQLIVGSHNLVILDNESRAPAVTAIYSNQPADVVIFSYAGFHNNVHYVERFREFYQALSSSCEFFIFLDTDEFLVWIENDHVFMDRTVTDRISACRGVDLLPGTWLQNVTGASDRYWIGNDNRLLCDGLRWGKPVLSTRAPLAGLINHNSQVGRALKWSDLVVNCFVLHRSRLSNAQRISANMKKLVARGAIGDASDVSLVLEGELERFEEGNTRMYAREVRELWPHRDQPVVRTEKPPGGSIEISPSGTITYSTSTQQQVLQNYLRNPLQVIEMALS